MVQRQIPLTFLCILLILLVATDSTVYAAQEWTSLTSFRTARQMLQVGDSIYMATSGGLYVVTDPGEPGTAYLNTDGLGTTDLTDLTVGSQGHKWLTGYGRLVRFSADSSRAYLFEDNDGDLINLNCVVDDGNFLWVGTDIGLVLFSKAIDGGQIQDSYSLFGDLNANAAVNAILLDGDLIWVATEVGLAVADRSVPNDLKAPASWTVFDKARYPELINDNMLSLVGYRGDVYAGAFQGFYRVDAVAGNPDTSFALMPVRPSAQFRDLQVERDTLFFYCTDWTGGYGGMGYVYQDNNPVLLPLDGLSKMPTGGVNTGRDRWVSILGGGLYYWDDDEFVAYPYDGLPGDYVTDVAVSRDSQLVAGLFTERSAGVSGSTWSSIWVGGSWTTDVILDSSGGFWVGSYGNGLWWIGPDTAINYDETNSPLIGNSENDRYIVIYGLATDGRYLYAAAYRAVNGRSVIVADLQNLDSPAGWTSFGTDVGIATDRPVGIAWHNNVLAVATEATGVYLCYLGPDPFDRSDYEIRHFTRSNSWLVSNDTYCAEFSPQGVLWVGTNFGLTWFDAGIDRFIEVGMPVTISTEVTDLAIDGRGNVWLATPNGLGRYDITARQFEVFTSVTSGLIDDRIEAVTIDVFTNNLYVSTPRGISLRSSDIGRPVFEVERAVAFPNPFVIRDDTDELNFTFGSQGTVQLFTVAGELVNEFPVNQPWRGRNAAGREVASGVYIFVITDQGGQVGTGKILLVRE